MFKLTLLICFLFSIIITPFIIKLAYKINATDIPDPRKIHHSIMPRIGGLAIFSSFLVGIILYHQSNDYHIFIVFGCVVIVLTGFVDDIFQLSAKTKLIAQSIAAFVVIYGGEIQVEFINLPIIGKVELGFFSIPFTVIWILVVTNAINLIDGLDGLAAGVSSIALITITSMAIIMGNTYVVIVSSLVLVSTLGFLCYNFHPARIFMGDSGALFLGYMIAVLSLLGFKNITFISFIIPVIILGVPLSDTFFAIVRRIINNKPIYEPDNSHLHHCLLDIGFTHTQTVLLIYAVSAFFGISAIILSQVNFWGLIFFLIILFFVIELFVENLGLIGKDFKPLLNIIRGKWYLPIKNR